MNAGFALTRPMPPVTHVLHPGDVVVAAQGDRLETLLGSCVAIALTDPRRTVGALCHFVHRGSGPDARYAEQALRAMWRGLLALGIQPQLCEAHVAGGGHMFPALGAEGAGDVGAANARCALELLAANGLAVRSSSLGGPTYRRLAWTVGEPAPSVQCVGIAAPNEGFA